jgi:TPR repeat protein
MSRLALAALPWAAISTAFATDPAAARKTCEAGRAPDCVVAALALVRGEVGLPDRSAAAALLRRACQAGEAEGCFDLALLLDDEGRASSSPVPSRDARAHEEGCDAGDPSDCYALARTYAPSTGDPLQTPTAHKADPSRAAALYRRAAELADKSCEVGNMPACLQLGIQYQLGQGVSRDRARAMASLSQACAADLSKACLLIGIAYKVHPGNGADADAEQTATLSLLSGACSGGLPSACGKLADKSDPEKAIPLYAQACDGHVAWACTTLGYNYALGTGVPVDADRALAFFARGCDAGDKGGCSEAAQASIGRDNARAASFHEKACNLGEARSCFALGNAYLAGIGVPKDEVRATQFLRRGCADLSHAERDQRKECQ